MDLDDDPVLSLFSGSPTMLMLKSMVDSAIEMFGICMRDSKGIDTVDGVSMTIPGLSGSGKG